MFLLSLICWPVKRLRIIPLSLMAGIFWMLKFVSEFSATIYEVIFKLFTSKKGIIGLLAVLALAQVMESAEYVTASSTARTVGELCLQILSHAENTIMTDVFGDLFEWIVTWVMALGLCWGTSWVLHKIAHGMEWIFSKSVESLKKGIEAY